MQRRGQPGDVGDDLDPLGLRLRHHERAHVADDLLGQEVRRLRHELAGLDLREVEDVVDDREEMPGRALHLAQLLPLTDRQRVAADEMREADDRVHRRADLVAHVGEEGALRARRGLRGIARDAECSVRRLEPRVEQRRLVLQAGLERRVLDEHHLAGVAMQEVRQSQRPAALRARPDDDGRPAPGRRIRRQQDVRRTQPLGERRVRREVDAVQQCPQDRVDPDDAAGGVGLDASDAEPREIGVSVRDARDARQDVGVEQFPELEGRDGLGAPPPPRERRVDEALREQRRLAREPGHHALVDRVRHVGLRTGRDARRDTRRCVRRSGAAAPSRTGRRGRRAPGTGSRAPRAARRSSPGTSRRNSPRP